MRARPTLKPLDAAYFPGQHQQVSLSSQMTNEYSMSTGGLRHLAHREQSDIDGVEPVLKTRKLKGLTTASGRYALGPRIF